MKKIIFSFLLLAGTAGAWAQSAEHTKAAPASGLDANTVVQANNPMSTKKTFNVHNYIIPSVYGDGDLFMNQLMFRYAQPIGRVFLRATMPFVTESFRNSAADTTIEPAGATTGLGDLSLFAIYKLTKSNTVILGIGPQIIMPTATRSLGQGKWQAGLSAMAFIAKSPVVQIGALLQWQMSFAGDDDRPDVNMLTPQLFFIWQAGGGTYLRSSGAWSFDLKHGAYNIPLGLGIGKVIKSGKTVFNIFMEPQYSVASQGLGQSRFQVFVGFNTQW